MDLLIIVGENCTLTEGNIRGEPGHSLRLKLTHLHRGYGVYRYHPMCYHVRSRHFGPSSRITRNGLSPYYSLAHVYTNNAGASPFVGPCTVGCVTYL